MSSHFTKRFIAGTALGFGMLFGSHAALAQDALSTEQKIEIEGVIEQYLLENPDVLLRAIQNVQTWQASEQARQQAEAITPVWDALVADSSVPSVGPVDAPVTVIEFFDYHCGYCKRAFDGVKEIAENSDGKVRTIFVEFPILREESGLAARAALAAAKQGKYMPGSHIPILPLKVLVTSTLDYALILPWNIAAEVKRQNAILVAQGTKFVTAVPQLEILN